MKNQEDQPKGKSIVRFSMPTPSRERPDLKLTKPEKYPCFVLRVLHGQYFIMPLFFIRNIDDLPSELPEVFRLIVVDEIPTKELSEKLIHKLKNIIIWECSRQGWQSCLALNPDRGIFYSPETKKFRELNKAPSNSDWLNESEFLNHSLMEMASGKISPMNSPAKEIYFEGQQVTDLALIDQISTMGHTLMVTELFKIKI